MYNESTLEQQTLNHAGTLLCRFLKNKYTVSPLYLCVLHPQFNQLHITNVLHDLWLFQSEDIEPVGIESMALED